MARGYIPGSDAGVVTFTATFGSIVGTNPTHYGRTATEMTAYNAKQVEFAARVNEAISPGTRGKRTVFLKNEAKKELVALTRKYAQQIATMTTVTNDQRQELGITVRSTTRTKVPVPTTKPYLIVTRVDGRTATVELRKTASTRGKPAQVAGATIVYRFNAGDEWTFAANTTKTTEIVQFPASDTGDTVEVTAFWNNSKDESGPAATPVSINLPAGDVLPSEEIETPILKAA